MHRKQCGNEEMAENGEGTILFSRVVTLFFIFLPQRFSAAVQFPTFITISAVLGTFPLTFMMMRSVLTASLTIFVKIFMSFVQMRCFLALFVVYCSWMSVHSAWSPGSFRSAEADHVSAALLNVMLLQAPSLLGHAYHLDPSDYFTGALHRPRLEIIHPENGQVLDNGALAIEIKLDGYDLPSHFHDSRVCVGLSSGSWVAEQCFDQSLDLVFHVNGLTAGLQYALRIVFYERGNAIAVSVRNFRVGGIKGLLNSNPEEAVSILTAVQVT